MKNRWALFETYRDEQRKYLTSGNPARAADIVNMSVGSPPPMVGKLLAKIPGKAPRQLLNFLQSKARQKYYILTHSALLIGPYQHPNKYYDLTKINKATPDEATAMVYLLAKNDGECAIGPLERPTMFAKSINAVINGVITPHTCNACIHYHRHDDPTHGNAGSCHYQPHLLGNYDYCCNLTLSHQ